MGGRAYGAVYRGVQKGSGNVFAIKVITALGNAAQKEELEKEIEILKNASHKNIVTYYGSLSADDAFWVRTHARTAHTHAHAQAIHAPRAHARTVPLLSAKVSARRR